MIHVATTGEITSNYRWDFPLLNAVVQPLSPSRTCNRLHGCPSQSAHPMEARNSSGFHRRFFTVDNHQDRFLLNHRMDSILSTELFWHLLSHTLLFYSFANYKG